MPEPEKPEVKPAEKTETLIFGKYKTMEEAEKGYKAAEQMAHDKAAEAARNKQALDELVLAEPKVNDGGGNTTVEETEETFAQRFMEQPRKFLEQYGRDLSRSVAQSLTGYIETRETVKDFLSENADCKENLRLFTVALHSTNPKSAVPERLKEAATETRKEINRIKQQGIEAQKANDAEQRKVAAGGADAGSDPPQKKEDPAAGQSYAEYMAERATAHGKVLGIV
jgi:hypothetical protein